LETDNEILQDFLIESGEILEKLSGQLVDLERRPADKELLNAVFRGFHTVKGGAGFLNIGPLVEVCHRAEDVFNVLRQGRREVDAPLMDAVLRVVDIVNAMMEAVRCGRAPEPADPALLAQLGRLAEPQSADVSAPANAAKEAPEDSVEAQFEALLAAPIQQHAAKPGGSGNSDLITDEEFEALLDQLHGKGVHGGVPAAVEAPAAGEAEPDRPSRETAVQVQADITVRVDTKRLDDIMNLVGELVLVRNRLDTLKTRMGNDQVAQAISNLAVVTSELQAAVMKTRMQPIKKVFGRFPRVVRDLSRSLDKEIELKLMGEETELDKNLVEALADPLVHLIRNAVDHGIETPAVRAAAGKPVTGTVTLSARQEGDHILLVIKDDGAGMNADKLRGRAVEKGLLDPGTAARLDERACYDLIFMPGFSTKTEISDISGRGVGMDVVKTRIVQLNGSVEIDSKEGAGTEITIKLPLTLAIVPTLMVTVDGQVFAIPLSGVSEIIQSDAVRKNVVNGQAVAVLRGHPLPLFHLRDCLPGRIGPAAVLQASYIVVIKVDGTRVACVVDQLIAQEEVVIKPLGALLQGLPGVAGATITGDGRIAVILDMPGLISRYAGRPSQSRCA
jgi:two-component system chemotaxis sensor kinase CheA